MCDEVWGLSETWVKRSLTLCFICAGLEGESAVLLPPHELWIGPLAHSQASGRGFIRWDVTCLVQARHVLCGLVEK